MPSQRQALRVTRLPITVARINLGAVVKRVHLGKEHFILEKSGIPIAALINVPLFEELVRDRQGRGARGLPAPPPIPRGPSGRRRPRPGGRRRRPSSSQTSPRRSRIPRRVRAS